MNEEERLWGVHMDISVGMKPVDEGYVGIRWAELGDLSRISASRDAFKSAIEAAHPDAKPGSIPVQAGVIYRFLHEVKDGDIIVYPSKTDRMINSAGWPGRTNSCRSATPPIRISARCSG